MATAGSSALVEADKILGRLVAEVVKGSVNLADASTVRALLPGQSGVADLVAAANGVAPQTLDDIYAAQVSVQKLAEDGTIQEDLVQALADIKKAIGLPAPTIGLASDTGASSSDLVTSDGHVNVSGVVGNNTWQYSIDGGTTWTAGTGASFVVASDGQKDVLVRQVNPSGNAGLNASLSFTLDRTAGAAPTLALASDSGASGSDKITNAGTVNVTGLESPANWQYSTNGGTSWTAGTCVRPTLRAT